MPDRCKKSTNFDFLSFSRWLTVVIAFLRGPPTLASKRKYTRRTPEVTSEPLRNMAAERSSGSGHRRLRDAKRVRASREVSMVPSSAPSSSTSYPA